MSTLVLSAVFMTITSSPTVYEGTKSPQELKTEIPYPRQLIHCSDYEVMCPNLKCITEYRVCDGHNDCEDFTDEIGCGTSDQPCRDINGTCQYNSNPCESIYIWGLCAGPRDRECCVP